jgi:hypothetical protein
MRVTPISGPSTIRTPHFYQGDITDQVLSTTFDPENRLVARGLETEWEKRLRDLASAEAELERRERQ